MQALILAGGFGTRLRPLTLETPKPVVELVGRPILAYQLDLLRRAGITDVILSLNYQPTKIQEVIGDGAPYGVQVRYVVEPEPRGTAGAVKFAGEFIRETTVILNGDNLINLDISEVVRYHRAKRALATVVLEEIENPALYGLVEIAAEDNRILNFLEKPGEERIKDISIRTVNAGTYVLEPEVLDLIPPEASYSFEYGVFPELLRRGEKFFAFVTDSYWLDVGTPERYLEASQDIINRRVTGFEITDDRSRSEIALTAEVSDNSFLGAGTRIGREASVLNSVLGEGVLTGDTALIENSVIGAGTRIGAGASVSGAIIGRNCLIGNYVSLSPGAVLGDGSVLTDYGKV
jgi:NDP-sugar pyrophosphorylase family protein